MKKEMQKSGSWKLFLGLIVSGLFLFMIIGCVGIVIAAASGGGTATPYNFDKSAPQGQQFTTNTVGVDGQPLKPATGADVAKLPQDKEAFNTYKGLSSNEQTTALKGTGGKGNSELTKKIINEGGKEAGKLLTPDKSSPKDASAKLSDNWKEIEGNKDAATQVVKELYPNVDTKFESTLKGSSWQGDTLKASTSKGIETIDYSKAGNLKSATIDSVNGVNTAKFAPNAGIDSIDANAGQWEFGGEKAGEPAAGAKSPAKDSIFDPKNPFQPQGAGGSGGGGDAAGGAGGEAGGAQAKMKEAFGMAQQMVGLAKEFLSGLQTNLQSDAEQKAKTGTSAVEMQAAAQEGVVSVENAQVQLATSSTTVDTTSPNPNGKATFTFDSELKVFTIKTDYPATTVADTTSTGAGALVSNDNAAIAGILSPSSTTTTVTNDADSTTPLLTTSASNVGTVAAFLTLAGYVVNDVVNGQNVKFIKQDIEINGNDIIVYALKPFSHIEGGGKGIILGDGSVDIKFEEEKTLYPRTVKENEFFINKLTNKQDPDKYFALIPGGTAGNYFLDNKKRISVGDNSVEHPSLKGVKIAEIRKDMWKK